MTWKTELDITKNAGQRDKETTYKEISSIKDWVLRRWWPKQCKFLNPSLHITKSSQMEEPNPMGNIYYKTRWQAFLITSKIQAGRDKLLLVIRPTCYQHVYKKINEAPDRSKDRITPKQLGNYRKAQWANWTAAETGRVLSTAIVVECKSLPVSSGGTGAVEALWTLKTDLPGLSSRTKTDTMGKLFEVETKLIRIGTRETK